MAGAAFVIPAWNSAATITQCLKSLMPYYPEHIREIIVVDANSSDGTKERIKPFPVKVVTDPGRGQALACEMGWRSAKGDPVVFFDADAYLGENFFPEVFRYLEDDAVGIVGCHPLGTGTTTYVSRAQSEWWQYSGDALLRPKPGLLQRAHRLVFSQRDGNLPPLGPCQIVRRACLEEVDGYRGLSMNLPTDVGLASRILSAGWKGAWWPDAPVYHHPRGRVKDLLDEFFRFGRESACLHRDPEFSAMYPRRQRVATLMSYLAAPMLGVFLAARFRNLSHAALFPLARYTWLAGYLLSSGEDRRKGTVP